MSDPDHPGLEVFWRLHEGLSQQGPGSDASTRRALASVPDLPAEPKILDLGCGPGRQSLVLARDTGGHVTAIDLIAPFLEQLASRAAAAGLGDRIETRQASMLGLDYSDESFDLIWSEGAVYNIGFEAGLRDWRRLLRPGAALAVTECTWLVEAPPARVRSFWSSEYPDMQDHAANLRAAEAAGYEVLDSFALTASEWWDDYYSPIEERTRQLRAERSDEAWLAAIAAADREMEIVREGLPAFGYVFYVLRKPPHERAAD